MRKILMMLLVGLTVPVICLAAGAGGSANRYHLEIDPIGWRTGGTTNYDSVTTTLQGGAAGFGEIGGNIDTSIAIDVTNLVCPMGASAFLGFSATFATGTAAGDSAGIQIQWSPDGSTWFGVNTIGEIVGQTPSVGLAPTANTVATTPSAYNIVVEAATVQTTPMWKKVRFLVQHWDGSANATTIGSFKCWFHRFVKDN